MTFRLHDKKSKLKILLWAPFGSGNHFSGPGQSAFRMYDGLDKSKYELHLAHGTTEQQHEALFDSITHISTLKRKSPIQQLLFLFLSKNWIKKNGHKFDVMHVLSIHHIGFMPAYWMKKIHRIPTYIKVQMAGAGFKSGSMLSQVFGLARYRKKVSNFIDGYIAISDTIRKNLIDASINPDKIHFIPNGVNTDVFRPADSWLKTKIRKELTLKKRFTLLYVGGLSERKGPSLIVDACRLLQERNFDFTLLIVGPDRDNGNERRKIMDIIAKCPKLEDRVKLIGFTPDTLKYYQSSDMFVLPSRNEGMSNSLLEALSCGLPSIVTPVSGSKDLVVDGWNGSFVDRDPKCIMQKIEYYLTSGDQLLDAHSKNARKKVEPLYDSGAILEKHLKLFRHDKSHY